MNTPDLLTSYHRKIRLRQCVRGSCQHEFCPNRKLTLEELQTTPEEKKAWADKYKLMMASNPFLKKANKENSAKWKRDNVKRDTETKKKWRQSNPEKVLEINKRYRENNK